MTTPEQVIRYWRERKTRLAPVMAAATLMRTAYNGELPVATPEMSSQERAAIANLFQTGIDQYGMRVGSTMPDIDMPALKATRSARDKATDRKNTVMAWQAENGIPRKMRRRARYLGGYATSPVYIRPGDGIPCWEVRNPLETYPAACDPDDLVPPDCIFAIRRPLSWLQAYYGRQIRNLSVGDAGPDTMFDVLQYCDANQLMLVAVGKDDRNGNSSDVTLSDVPNLAGRPLVVIPGRITLDRLMGQFDQLVGMYQTQAELWAMQLIAVKRAVFGEAYAVGNAEMDFQEADPITGEMGYVKGGDVKVFRVPADSMALNAIDRLERNERVGGGIAAEMGGESPSNVRTGSRGRQVTGAQVDFPVQELQELLAASYQEEIKAAIAVAKGWFGGTSKTFAVAGARQPVTYTPNLTFDTDAVFVSYAYAGTDTNGLVIEGGQRIGMGTLSKQSYMRNDPMVKDPDAEHDLIQNERLEEAFLQSIQAQAADPNGPWQPAQLARLTELIYDKNMPLYKAVQQVHEEAQKAQAAAAQVQPGEAPMQPGIGQAGAPGTPQAAAAIQGPNSSTSNLAQLLGSLRQPQRTSPAEMANAGG